MTVRDSCEVPADASVRSRCGRKHNFARGGGKLAQQVAFLQTGTGVHGLTWEKAMSSAELCDGLVRCCERYVDIRRRGIPTVKPDRVKTEKPTTTENFSPIRHQNNAISEQRQVSGSTTPEIHGLARWSARYTF